MRPASALAFIALFGCQEPTPDVPLPAVILGGVSIPGETLKTGERAYRAVCTSCHGAAGDGNGRLGIRQDPKPRDFAQGVIKFASVPAGALWTDEDVLRTLRHGLAGTQMIAIKLPEDDLRAVTHYLKTFSPLWTTETPGVPVEVPETPTLDATARAASVRRGEALYRSRCAECHDASVEVATVWPNPIRSPVLAGYRAKVGSDPQTLYRTLAAGVGGIEGKKALAGELSAGEIWDLVRYTQTLLN